MTLTIRQHLEAIRPVHAEVAGVCCWCRTKWPCGHSITLDAVIKALDEAARPGSWTEYRAVYDPAPPTEEPTPC